MGIVNLVISLPEVGLQPTCHWTLLSLSSLDFQFLVMQIEVVTPLPLFSLSRLTTARFLLWWKFWLWFQRAFNIDGNCSTS